MTQQTELFDSHTNDAFFESATWYDISINWKARLGREIPLMVDVLGEPTGQAVLDAGCGPGHHVAALAGRGYAMTGLDASPQMLEIAQERLRREERQANWIHARYDELDGYERCFDGIFCIGNALAACGSAVGVQTSVRALADSLKPGGRLLLQVLNFARLRDESPKVRGPRVTDADGRQFISTRVYAFVGDEVEVTNVTLYQQKGAWKQFARCGRLYAVSPNELRAWLAESGLNVDDMMGGYDRAPFDAKASNDLIVVATRKAD